MRNDRRLEKNYGGRFATDRKEAGHDKMGSVQAPFHGVHHRALCWVLEIVGACSSS